MSLIDVYALVVQNISEFLHDHLANSLDTQHVLDLLNVVAVRPSVVHLSDGQHLLQVDSVGLQKPLPDLLLLLFSLIVVELFLLSFVAGVQLRQSLDAFYYEVLAHQNVIQFLEEVLVKRIRSAIPLLQFLSLRFFVHNSPVGGIRCRTLIWLVCYYADMNYLFYCIRI